ncbi:KAP family NTPase [Phaeobacter inhibens]|uniref:KAP family NTPase n=1 Tax=Phaeobacter inhibens TaxID=221822 RepID=UPI0021A2630E|nr:KAP family NTPase [Phaeobacter inhibens]UWR51475.1 KAP family NTPase [Phaeobacter inhibens]
MKVAQKIFRWFKERSHKPYHSTETSSGKAIMEKLSSMSHLQEYLSYYTTLTAPGYAVLVTGDWGTGKTYQVKSCLPEEDRLYVSLFGVQTVEQLHSEVFAAAAPTMAKAEKMVGKGSDIVAGMKGPWALAGAIPSVFNAVFKREIEPTKTLVFDDLERSDLELKDVLGAINSYVEHLGFRVVVVAHDERLADEFLQMKEKTFGQSIRVEPQIEDALSHFLEDIGSPSAKKFASDFKDQVQDTFLRSKVKSLRILRHVIEDLTRLHGVLGEEHLKNADAMEDLTKTFVAFQIEVRAGHLLENDLQNRRGARYGYMLRVHAKKDNPPETPALIKADDKYPTIDLEGGILNDDVLCAMLVDGRFPEDQIRASIENSAYFLVPEDVAPWKVISHFDDLEDRTVDEAMARMKRQFEEREVTSSGEMLHIFCLRMMMAEQNIIDRNVEDVFKENLAYIDDLLNKGALPARGTDWRWYDEFERSYDGFGYWVSQGHEDYFKETWGHLIAAREEALRRKFPKILNELLQMVRENPKGFFEAVSPTNNGPNPYAVIPLLHEIPPVEFVNSWMEAPRENWRDIQYALENRYSSNQLERDLAPEKDWALQVLKELERRADDEAGFRALRIKRVRPKILVELAHEEDSTESTAAQEEA